MGTSTPSIFAPNYAAQVISEFMSALAEAQAHDAQILWNVGMAFLWQHLIAVAIILFLILAASFIRALTGRWGWFGSVLYNYLYFGTLWIIGLIFGPTVFTGDYFKLVLFILYVVCYIIVGKIIHKLNLRGRHW